MTAQGRNSYVLSIDVEMTQPISLPYARPAAELLALYVREHLKEIDWGYGMARVKGAYAPDVQFINGDFTPNAGEIQEIA